MRDGIKQLKMKKQKKINNYKNNNKYLNNIKINKIVNISLKINNKYIKINKLIELLLKISISKLNLNQKYHQTLIKLKIMKITTLTKKLEINHTKQENMDSPTTMIQIITFN